MKKFVAACVSATPRVLFLLRHCFSHTHTVLAFSCASQSTEKRTLVCREVASFGSATRGSLASSSSTSLWASLISSLIIAAKHPLVWRPCLCLLHAFRAFPRLLAHHTLFCLMMVFASSESVLVSSSSLVPPLFPGFVSVLSLRISKRATWWVCLLNFMFVLFVVVSLWLVNWLAGLIRLCFSTWVFHAVSFVWFRSDHQCCDVTFFFAVLFFAVCQFLLLDALSIAGICICII